MGIGNSGRDYYSEKRGEKVKLLKLLLLMSFVLILSGCYDASEPNELTYATAIGIDKSTDNNYNITIQFAKPHNISGGENGGSGEDIIGNVTVEAPNIFAAIGLGNHIISKTIDLSHLQLFVFSQDVAKEGIKNFIETISRSKEIRPNVYTCVCIGKAMEYLKSASPVVDINPAKYYHLIFGKSNFKSIPETYSQDLYFYKSLPEKNCVLPLTGIPEDKEKQQGGQGEGGSGGQGQGGDQNNKQEQGSKETTPNKMHYNAPVNYKGYEYRIRDYMSGQIEVLSSTKGEVTGSAVFKQDKMLSTLGMIETQIYNYLVNNKSKNYITFKGDEGDIPVTVLLGTDKNTSISYDKKEHKATVKMWFSANFVSLPEEYMEKREIEYFEKVAQEAIKAETYTLLEKTQKEFNSDIVGFGEYAKIKFLTRGSFDSFHWDRKYKDLAFDVQVKVGVKRTGLTTSSKK